jgi:hypothetical protein
LVKDKSIVALILSTVLKMYKDLIHGMLLAAFTVNLASEK